MGMMPDCLGCRDSYCTVSAGWGLRLQVAALALAQVQQVFSQLVPEMVRGGFSQVVVALRGYNGVTIFPIQLGFEASLRRIV
jgi:hypothetical protein